MGSPGPGAALACAELLREGHIEKGRGSVMASFCYDCLPAVFPGVNPAQNDIAHGEAGEMVWDVCENCGPGWFDAQGKRVEEEEEAQG